MHSFIKILSVSACGYDGLVKAWKWSLLGTAAHLPPAWAEMGGTGLLPHLLARQGLLSQDEDFFK